MTRVDGKRRRKAQTLLRDDVHGGPVCEGARTAVGATICRAVKCRSIGPHHGLQIVLGVLTAGGEGIPVQAVTGTNNGLGSELPSEADAWSPVIRDRRRREETLPCQDDVAEICIGQETIWDAGRLLCHTTNLRHHFSADNVLLVSKIQGIPEAAIERRWLRDVIVTQAKRQGHRGLKLPLILRIGGPGGVLESHGATVINGKLSREAIWEAQQCRGKRQARGAIGNGLVRDRVKKIARLLVAEGISVEGIELDSLGFDVPEARSEIVPTLQPGHIRGHAPVGVLAGSGSANAETIVAPVRPVGQGNKQAVVLVDVFETRLLQRIESSRILVLLAGVDRRAAGIARANIKDESWTEGVYPAATIVATLGTAACRAILANGGGDVVPLLRVAEKHVVRVAEAMVNSRGIAV